MNTSAAASLDLDLDIRVAEEEMNEEFEFGNAASMTSPNPTLGVQTMCPACCA